MCRARTAVVLSAGTELTEGITQDAHTRYLAAELTGLGFSLLRGVQVPDDGRLFREELDRACGQAGLVVVTGGLGPTSDDLTREVVAAAAGVQLVFHPAAWDRILERFKGRKVSETNRKQATAPADFPLIDNPNGTAPGFSGTVGGALVVALPGPPAELRPMFADSVKPLLAAAFGLGGAEAEEMLRGTALMVPESALEEALRSCRSLGVTWGTRVDEDRIGFSLRGGSGEDRESVLSALQAMLDPVRIRRGECRPAELLVRALGKAGTTLATAESCTGGLLGRYVTDIPGSSRVYWGGWVVYANEAKQELLGVEPGLLARHGAVSREAVAAMVRGALARSPAGIAVAVSGIAGPEGGSPERPVGTVWIACGARGGGGEPAAIRFSFAGGRDAVRRRAAAAAMLFAESLLEGRDFLDSAAKW